ncbi:MAG: family N-acetyltransferase [Symbiobacteriaceae bacterium]|jgi:GNAT superfamily N-acetyltransferase|nr:family N-acetyltransferase [Symbiobacteriaceae bacterium]
MYEVRHAVEPDYEAIAEIATRTRPEPFTADEFLKDDRRALADPNLILHRLVAVRPADGRVVGYGFSERCAWEPAGRWSVYAAVHPDCRGLGAGRAILEQAERIAREGGATELQAWCRGEADESFAWAQRRGYALKRQRTESVLDLSKPDFAKFAPAVDRVRESGITLIMQDGLTVPEGLLRQVYELDRVTSPDVPAWDAGDSFPAWEQYRKDWYECHVPYVVALALDGDKVVGLSTLYYSHTPGKSAGIGYTAVLREYRGRSIALALKLLTMEDAMRRGIPRIRTNNDPDNPSMLAINVKLGFQFIPGPRLLQKQL